MNDRKSQSLLQLMKRQQRNKGRKDPGDLERAFKSRYPNRGLSERLGPKLESDATTA